MSEDRNKRRRERIEALDSINEDVTSMLRAAGLAIAALTNRPLETSDSISLTGDPVEDRKSAFKQHATDYFTRAKRLKSSLEAESEALQEDELIPAKRPPARTETGDDTATNDGLGNFDIGWLNSRNNNVARRKEAEVWKEARQLLEKLERKHETSDHIMKDGEVDVADE